MYSMHMCMCNLRSTVMLKNRYMTKQPKNLIITGTLQLRNACTSTTMICDFTFSEVIFSSLIVHLFVILSQCFDRICFSV